VKYYRFHEYNPKDWKNTEELLAMGATHYGTNMFGDISLRKFVMLMSDEDALAAKLRFGHEVDIYEMSQDEIDTLRNTGYIKDNHK
jgi:hypothetical protein